MKKLPIQSMILIALFAAILTVLSQLAIPLPSGVPVTLQTLAVALCGFTLGARRGATCVCVYLALGAVGLPVFAGFLGGVGILFGVTGGFLWGFIAMAALCGTRRAVPSALGLLACHVLGILQFALVSGSSPWSGFLVASAPYLVKDIVSVVLAYLASKAVRRGLSAARLSMP